MILIVFISHGIFFFSFFFFNSIAINDNPEEDHFDSMGYRGIFFYLFYLFDCCVWQATKSIGLFVFWTIPQ